MTTRYEYQKAWAKANPDKVAAKYKRWREKNQQKVKVLRESWLEANPTYHKEWKQANKDKMAKYGRKSTLKRKYNISIEQYNEMLVQQNGGCKICQEKPLNGSNLCVDHCHKTGKVRGLLCQTHNRALGLFNDDYDLLVVAANYIKDNQ